MIVSGGYQPYFEQLVVFASAGELEQEIKQARGEYFSLSGGVREDEPSFEPRIEAFTEWYVLDRVLGDGNKTPLELYLSSKRGELGAEEVEVYEGFRNSQRGVFEFLKTRKEHLLVRDLSTRQKVAIFERRQPAGLEKGAVLEARVLNFRGNPIFTKGIIYHPMEVRKFIVAEVKKLMKQDPAAYPQLVRWLSLARLRCDRYRRVDPVRLYRQTIDEQLESAAHPPS